MSLIFRLPVGLHLVGYMVNNEKYVQIVFEVCRLTISMKMPECAAVHSCFLTGCNGKHAVIKDDL